MISDAELRQSIERLCRERAPKTICPSEVARAVAKEWRPLMGRVRRVALELVEAGRIDIWQKGRAVDPETIRGPIRLRWRGMV